MTSDTHETEILFGPPTHEEFPTVSADAPTGSVPVAPTALNVLARLLLEIARTKSVQNDFADGNPLSVDRDSNEIEVGDVRSVAKVLS